VLWARTGRDRHVYERWTWYSGSAFDILLHVTTNKRITDLSDYSSVLPYASELFGVYQPMIGWRSKRMQQRREAGTDAARADLLSRYLGAFRGQYQVDIAGSDCFAEVGNIDVGMLGGPAIADHPESLLLATVAEKLPPEGPPADGAWADLVNNDLLREVLTDVVAPAATARFHEDCIGLHNDDQDEAARGLAEQLLETRLRSQLGQESALAGALLGMVDQGLFGELRKVFYRTDAAELSASVAALAELLKADADPFATFDPAQDISSVSLSPLGIVHLFRQFFFELDTFLGTPTGHVWLSPGSTVELIEVSTRREYIERVVEQATDTLKRVESSTTDQDELSEAVKQDNKNDLKLGASLTVNQSWGTGNATATASLNMDQTQDVARENSHKRMREQSDKLTTEIKQSYKSTFKTVTETTDTSSKRYLLTNSTGDLINYELRRKMRQVGVQVQDVGTYLCWETFVDEPGRELGLANLVNIAKPVDLDAVPDETAIPIPPDVPVPFTANVAWTYDDTRQYNGPDGFIAMTAVGVPPAPDGYEVKTPDAKVPVFQVSGTGDDFHGTWGFGGKLQGTSQISLGVATGRGGIKWDKHIDFVVTGTVMFTPSAAKRKEIADANTAKVAAGTAATAANQRKTKEAYVLAAKERIEAASTVVTRKYEDLRDEERIVVYRELIRSLMSDALYQLAETSTNDEMRHTMSELINSVFDIDKMLYFVAPEWWKPRLHAQQQLADSPSSAVFAGNLTSWSDLTPRPDNYYITEKSLAAKKGSSLGWLLQLDGDDLRNAFLNAPWVKAVIPVRPGKELQALNWLQQLKVEGTEGLDDLYQAPADELAAIRAALGIADVTIGDAIKYLCAQVAQKYADGQKVGRYPVEEINDDNRVSALPVDKVYEHGFYPLQGGFRAVTQEQYEVFDQWIEVLPTDQVVPVPVTYDPKTGRQVP
jgi:hypothetical protein